MKAPRIGFESIARAVAMLPASERAIAKATGASRAVVVRWLRALQARHVVHCCSVERVSQNSWDRTYALGAGPVTTCLQDARRTTPPRPTVHVLNFVLMWRAIETPQTVSEIADAVGICDRQVHEYLSALRAERLAHVASWSPVAHNWAAAWARGNGPMVPKPRPQPRAVVNARYRQRVRERLAIAPLLQAMAAPVDHREAA